MAEVQVSDIIQDLLIDSIRSGQKSAELLSEMPIDSSSERLEKAANASSAHGAHCDSLVLALLAAQEKGIIGTYIDMDL